MNIKNLIIPLCLLVFSCVQPIEINISANSKVLFVDATITDENIPQIITIKQSVPSSGYITFLAISDATVTVNDSDKNIYTCINSGKGVYTLPTNFRAKAGVSYQLNIVTADKKNYQSSFEKMLTVPDIQSVTAKLDPEGYTFDATKYPAHNLYLTTKDIASSNEYYVWKWTDYEKQFYCQTCNGGLYYPNPYPGKCTTVSSLKGVSYDYQCASNCWEIFRNTDINIMSDALVSGGLIKDRLIGPIPLYQNYGCLIEISQQKVGPNANAYLKLLKSQGQTTGTLVDTAPAALIGNIVNLNDKTEMVGGYFMVAATKKYLFWLDRADASKLNPFGLFDGRRANPEPSGADLTRPPMAPCVPSNTRTPIQPVGWQN